ncbi:hypothetical protein BH11CYA1_BH11CYA1_14630 [soil metagenome]
MKEHSFGEQVLKESSTKDDAGKKVIDMARNAWGDLPAKNALDTAHRASETTPKEAALAAKEGATAGKDVGQVKDASNHKDRPHEAPKLDAHKNEQQLLEASHRIKQLNNELHKPGGPLASSALELVGFDKNGRLLLVQRDQTGQVDSKYLVDSESGKIVARTQARHLDKWEHGPGYKKEASKSGNDSDKSELATLKPLLDSRSGATVTKDSAGRVNEVTDFHGDKRSYDRDSKGNLSEVTIVQKGYEPVVYRPGSGVEGVSNHLWYKQPQVEGEQVQGFKFDVKADGTLIQHTNATQFTIYSPDGTITEHKTNGQEVVTRRGKPDASKDLKSTDISGPKPGALLA